MTDTITGRRLILSDRACEAIIGSSRAVRAGKSGTGAVLPANTD
jgi:hypothetical protein